MHPVAAVLAVCKHIHYAVWIVYVGKIFREMIPVIPPLQFLQLLVASASVGHGQPGYALLEVVVQLIGRYAADSGIVRQE